MITNAKDIINKIRLAKKKDFYITKDNKEIHNINKIFYVLRNDKNYEKCKYKVDYSFWEWLSDGICNKKIYVDKRTKVRGSESIEHQLQSDLII